MEEEIGFLAEVCWQRVRGTLWCKKSLHLGTVTDLGEERYLAHGHCKGV